MTTAIKQLTANRDMADLAGWTIVRHTGCKVFLDFLYYTRTRELVFVTQKHMPCPAKRLHKHPKADLLTAQFIDYKWKGH